MSVGKTSDDHSSFIGINVPINGEVGAPGWALYSYSIAHKQLTLALTAQGRKTQCMGRIQAQRVGRRKKEAPALTSHECGGTREGGQREGDRERGRTSIEMRNDETR